jgi:hypothetical protein
MTTNITAQNKDTSLLLLGNSAFITLFFFFIDEGYYNFNWMTNIGAWFIFALFTVVLFFIQVGISKLVGFKIQSSRKVAVGIIAATSFGVLALATILIV